MHSAQPIACTACPGTYGAQHADRGRPCAAGQTLGDLWGRFVQLASACITALVAQLTGTPCAQLVNPSETFGDIVIDYPYVELTSACITALVAFQRDYPQHRRAEVARVIGDGRRYILAEQRPDGSWYASWGVCFTYGAWFGCAPSQPALT